MRVLLIDSSPWDGDLIARYLSEHGCVVRVAARGMLGLGLLEREQPELVLLDPTLPDVNGYDLCQRIRELSSVPIIMLSGHADEVDVVRGLDAGADDFVARTVGPNELLARLDAVLRRAHTT